MCEVCLEIDEFALLIHSPAGCTNDAAKLVGVCAYICRVRILKIKQSERSPPRPPSKQVADSVCVSLARAYHQQNTGIIRNIPEISQIS